MNNIKNNTKHYRNSPLASRMLEMALLQEPISRTLELESWFYSLRISGSRMNDHATFEESALEGCVYDLHDENLFTTEQVVALMDTLERVLHMEGLAGDLVHYRFSIHIEGPEGDWLSPVHGVPFEKILNIINICSIFHEELANEDEDEEEVPVTFTQEMTEDVRQLESTTDSAIALLLPLLGEEERQHLCLAWSMASADIHSKFLGL